MKFGGSTRTDGLYLPIRIDMTTLVRLKRLKRLEPLDALCLNFIYLVIYFIESDCYLFLFSLL
jgi:hypothetical protein